MRDLINVIYGLGFIALMVYFMITLFIKAEYHFKLLKNIFPNRLSSIKSSYHFMFSLKYFELDIKSLIWYMCPFYYDSLKSHKWENEELLLKNKLLRNNFKMFISFLLMLIWLFGIGYLKSIIIIPK